jgi:hypothetical protein
MPKNAIGLMWLGITAYVAEVVAALEMLIFLRCMQMRAQAVTWNAPDFPFPGQIH